MVSNVRALLALGAVFCVSGAVASTPDGQTPSREDVCDGYTGAAFGLCNAYCEAMDCDDDPNADQQACDTVGAKFTARTHEAPPCDAHDWTCEDVGGSAAEPTEACPAKEGALQCTFGEPTIWYCDTAAFDAYGANTKFCFPTECKEETGPVCMDYGLKDVDGSVECRSDTNPDILECRGGNGTVWKCDTTKGTTVDACYDTHCTITY